MGIDIDWPKQNREMGARITYTCPYRMATFTEGLSGKELICLKLRINFLVFPPTQSVQENINRLYIYLIEIHFLTIIDEVHDMKH